MAATLPKLLNHIEHRRQDIRESHRLLMRNEMRCRALVVLMAFSFGLLALPAPWIWSFVPVMLGATVLLERFHRQVVVHRQRITKNRMERHDAWERIRAKRNKIAQEERQQELARTNKAAQKDLNRLLNRRQQSCGTKRQHPNMAAGYRHLARLAEKDSGAAEMCVYRCSYCNSWHVGHRQQKGAALWD